MPVIKNKRINNDNSNNSENNSTRQVSCSHNLQHYSQSHTTASSVLSQQKTNSVMI